MNVIWVFALVAFTNGEAIQANVAAGKPTKAECEVVLAKAQRELKSTPEVQFGFGECHPVKVPKAPPPKSPEVTPK